MDGPEIQKYKNLSGDSGVEAYAAGSDYLVVWFKNNSSLYLYNHIKPGHEQVEEMKQLAETGKGLSTYISRFVRENYYRKIDQTPNR